MAYHVGLRPLLFRWPSWQPCILPGHMGAPQSPRHQFLGPDWKHPLPTSLDIALHHCPIALSVWWVRLLLDLQLHWAIPWGTSRALCAQAPSPHMAHSYPLTWRGFFLLPLQLMEPPQVMASTPSPEVALHLLPPRSPGNQNRCRKQDSLPIREKFNVFRYACHFKRKETWLLLGR